MNKRFAQMKTDEDLALRVMKILDINDLFDWDETMSCWIELHGEMAYYPIFLKNWGLVGQLLNLCSEHKRFEVWDSVSYELIDTLDWDGSTELDKRIADAKQMIEICVGAIEEGDKNAKK